MMAAIKNPLSHGSLHSVAVIRIRKSNFVPQIKHQNIIFIKRSVTRNKPPNVYKSCPKLISLEK